MYLQITTKCNMSCDHCCYNCSMRGKHGDYYTIIKSIDFARDKYEDESITIGGGEPTLHPRFFDILKYCLDNFNYVWMATNGSQTDIMYRLNNIINGEDYPECTCEEDDPEQFAKYGCLCHEKYDNDSIYQENKLIVALSLDPWHDPIDDHVIDMWKRQSKNMNSHFEIRDVSRSLDGASAVGRAKKTGAGWAEDCVCADIIIKPDGRLKACGCTRSPYIGNVFSGIDEKYEELLESDNFRNTNCYFGK